MILVLLSFFNLFSPLESFFFFYFFFLFLFLIIVIILFLYLYITGEKFFIFLLLLLLLLLLVYIFIIEGDPWKKIKDKKDGGKYGHAVLSIILFFIFISYF